MCRSVILFFWMGDDGYWLSSLISWELQANKKKKKRRRRPRYAIKPTTLHPPLLVLVLVIYHGCFLWKKKGNREGQDIPFKARIYSGRATHREYWIPMTELQTRLCAACLPVGEEGLPQLTRKNLVKHEQTVGIKNDNNKRQQRIKRLDRHDASCVTIYSNVCFIIHLSSWNDAHLGFIGQEHHGFKTKQNMYI